MPDLTTHSAWACVTNRQWSTQVCSSRDPNRTYTLSWGPSRLGSPHEYDYHCTCKSFSNRKICLHIKDAINKDLDSTWRPGKDGHRCGWDNQWHDGEPIRMEDGRQCPCCGAEVYAYSYAV